ncbi:hypothetical protein MN608_06235 [Microdochium nivale]|nr:hypothetical protein MN608_06235 [Microdochium nivale]
MAPGSTNFKSYEAQIRLLAAVIATANPKLDFNAIQKLFGESTPGGLEWQFRDVKRIGKAQKEAVANGQSPVGVVNGIVGKRGGSAVSTPSGRASKHAPAPTPGSRASSSTLGGSARKRKATVQKNHFEDSNEGSGDDSDYSAKDVDLEATPSRKRTKPLGNGGETPRAAPVVGSGGSAQLFVQKPQQQQQQFVEYPAADLTPSTGTPATTATLTISPRKPPPKNYEIIDLSGTSPDASNSNAVVAPPQPAPLAATLAQPRVKAECSSHGTSGVNSGGGGGSGSAGPAYSFDGANDDPFAGYHGYAHQDEGGYGDSHDASDYGRPASDDEC